jgi:hypothetical protein
VSEENEFNEQNDQDPDVPEVWESQFQAHTAQILAQRIGPLRAEIEGLQSTINEISERLLEQAQASSTGPTEEETSGLINYVREWFKDSSSKAEREFQTRLEEVRAETEAATREEGEVDFQSRLEKARAEWETAAQEENKAILQRRLEQARAEWETAAQEENEAILQRRLEQARAEWETAAQEENEAILQRRLEQARAEWETAAQEENEAVFQRRLEQACAEAAAVARRESETHIEDIREQLEASRKALTLAVSTAQSAEQRSAGFEILRTAIEEIDGQRTQSETLSSLVRRAAQFAPRIVFFVVKGGDAIGWKTSGFDNGLTDETVRQLNVPTQSPSLLHEALTTFGPAVDRSTSPGEYSPVLGLYGTPAPKHAIAVPLVVRGKAAAVLYADAGTQSESVINMPAIETLMRVASMGIELLPARRGLEPPRPAVQSAQTGQVGVAVSATSGRLSPLRPGGVPEKPAAQYQGTPAEEHERGLRQTIEQRGDTPFTPTAEGSQATPSEPVLQGRTTDELVMPPGVAERLQEVESQRDTGPTAKTLSDEPGLTYGEERQVGEQTPLPPPSSTAPRDPYHSSGVSSAPSMPMKGRRQTADLAEKEEATRSSVQAVEESAEAKAYTQSPVFAPQPEPQRVAKPIALVPTPASETEQRAHNDARRFARLLISEIKLYNAAKVNEGRRHFDLYQRLKDEIDRSRKVYDKRVSPSVAERFDYFYDELVQTLAEGDAEKLGPGSPGPVVVAS